MTDSRPNILLISTDQQRYDSLGCYGGAGVCTPNLDRLARQGVRFEQCYVNNPVCTPSRASLWTGKHLPGHGVYHVHDCLTHDEVLFPARLRDAGYDTALIGKLHVSGHMEENRRRHPNDGFRLYEWTPDPHGFLGCDTAYHRWLARRYPEVLALFKASGRLPGHLPVAAHMTTWAAERTLDFLRREREMGKPFFCCMSVFDPHDPYCNYPEEIRRKLDEPRLAPITAFDEPFETRPLAHWLEHEHSYLASPAACTREAALEWRAGYHAAVALIDEQIGRVLAGLEESGLADNTLVIFTSDHGDMLGDHGLFVKGCFFYDPCTRVPLLLRLPGGPPAGQSIGALCQLHDIAATALCAAGLDPAQVREWMPDSVSLLDPAALERRGYAACLHRNSGVRVDHATHKKGVFDPPLNATMWREGRFKLNVYHSPPPMDAHAAGELFDLQSDPQELRNLWHDPAHRDTRERLMLRLLNWLADQQYRGRARGASAMPRDPAYNNLGRIA